MDPIWGYEAINVEAQLSDQSSLLHWTRNMIALRKLFKVFGRGTQEFLAPENRKVLAYLRHYDPESPSLAETPPASASDSPSTETVLCVANLSRFAQPVSLDLSRFTGMVPVEMLGYVAFPQITDQPYALTLAPYSFLWLELQPAPEVLEAPTVQTEEAALNLVTASWHDLMAGPGLSLIQELLPAYLVRQRWFGAKSRTITSVRIPDWVELPSTPAALVFIEVSYAESDPDIYQFPLALTSGPDAEAVRANAPASILVSLTTGNGPAILHDATAREDVRQALLTIIETESTLTAIVPTPAKAPSNSDTETYGIGRGLQPTGSGSEEDGASAPGPSLQGHKSSAFTSARGSGPLPARTGSAEQSNTSILYNSKLILKLFRRLQPGENPDTEIGRFLTEVAHFPRIAPFVGEIRGQSSPDAEPTTLAMLQCLVENQGDGWQFTLDELAHYYESVSSRLAPHDIGAAPSFLDEPTTTHIPAEAREHAGLYLDAAALLGRRTAEMHLALATPTDNPAFAAEPFTADALEADANRIYAQLARTLEALKRSFTTLPDELTADSAALILSRRLDLLRRSRAITEAPPEEAGQRIRIHGDYHLGQVLRARGDYVILDFEGEPARSLAERRAKQSPLRDVAGMLRSFSYAAYSALDHFTQRRPGTAKSLEPWAQLWQNAVSTEFLTAWRTTIANAESAAPAVPAAHLIPQPLQAHRLLNAYLLEKALYELLYELNNRPAWVRIPLAGILALP
jgi:maltose alpha-D-glucosyltransferase/alpha-amylase